MPAVWPGNGRCQRRGVVTLAGMLIKPITVRILAYGQKGNITKIKNVCRDHLDEELGEVPADAIADADAKAVAEEILQTLWDKDFALKKVTPSQAAVRILMPEVHERMTVEMLQELKMAKTCVMLATWHSEAQDEDHQLLFNKGEKWSDSRG